MQIIEEGSGNHFDPKIVEVFLDSSDEVRRVAEKFEMNNIEVVSIMKNPVSV